MALVVSINTEAAEHARIARDNPVLHDVPGARVERSGRIGRPGDGEGGELSDKNSDFGGRT